MRTFIASPVNLTNGIEGLLKQVSSLPSVRLPGGRNLHLTYMFLGDIGEKQMERVSEAVASISLKKVVSGFSGITAFPALSNPRVLVLLLDNLELTAIYNRINDLLPDFAAGSKKFIPHLTMGRFGKRNIKPDISELKVPDEKVIIDRVCLFKSTLTSSGPVYEELVSVQLI